MYGMPNLTSGLALLANALDSRKAALLDELRTIERDLEAVRRTLNSAARMGFGTENSSEPIEVAPQPPKRQAADRGRSADREVRPPAPTGLVDEVALMQKGQLLKERPIPNPAEATTAHASGFAGTYESVRSLGPVRDDASLPPKVNGRKQRIETRDIPVHGQTLDEIRDSVKEIAKAAASAPPGPGGRRYKSARSLVPGEPMMPQLRAIMQASKRPLTSQEVAVAILEARGLRVEGPELVSVVNRVSALLGQEAKGHRIRRLHVDGSRRVRWVTA